MNSITFIMKPVHACNAQCIYCSAYSEVERKGKMDLAVIRALLEKIVCYKEENPYLNRVLFIWHGGEPLLAGVKFYYEVMKLQEDILYPLDIDIENAMQSNLLLLTDSSAQMIKRLLRKKDGSYSNVGTSYDPIPGIRIVKGYDYSQRWLEKKELLLKHGVKYGVVYVVHKKSLERVEQIYDFFLGLYREDDAHARFNPLYAEGRAKKAFASPFYITPQEWGTFMIRFYKLWEREGKALRFDPFQEYDDFHYKGDFALSCESSGLCVNTHLGVDVDGSVFLCGRSIDEGSVKFGSILTQSLGEILLSKYRLSIYNRKAFLFATSCGSCNWWQYCHGGCPNDALISYSQLGKKTLWCEGRKMFFNEIYKKPVVRNQNGER